MTENTETTRHLSPAQRKFCYGADSSFLWEMWDNWSVMCDKLPWQTKTLRPRGGWNGSRGCIRGRIRVADVWRNLTRSSSHTGWNKVGHIRCQKNKHIIYFLVWASLIKPPVALQCVCGLSADSVVCSRSILPTLSVFYVLVSWCQLL